MLYLRVARQHSLACRINAAFFFRARWERRIYAAEGWPEESWFVLRPLKHPGKLELQFADT